MVLGGDVARTKEGGREISPMVRRPRGRVRAAVSGMCEGEETHGAGQPWKMFSSLPSVSCAPPQLELPKVEVPHQCRLKSLYYRYCLKT